MKKILLFTLLLAVALIPCFAQAGLSGTYHFSENYNITFTGNNFTGIWGSDPISGTYSVSGDKLTLNITGGSYTPYTWDWKIAEADIINDHDGDEWYKEGSSYDFEIYETVLVCYYGYAENVTIPAGITIIGEESFAEWTGLKSVNIPSSVTYIMESAFFNCHSLSSLTIPSSVTYIGDGAFAYCFSLTSITIPPSVTYIGDFAFAICSSLSSLTIPSSVTYIGEGAFYGCDNLRTITLSRNTLIGEGAFPPTSRIIYSD